MNDTINYKELFEKVVIEKEKILYHIEELKKTHLIEINNYKSKITSLSEHLKKYTAHKYTAHKYTAHKYTAHKYTAHKYTAHKYTAHKYTAHQCSKKYYEKNKIQIIEKIKEFIINNFQIMIL